MSVARSVPSASIWLTTISRQRWRLSTAFIMRTVMGSIPDWAWMTIAAVSTAGKTEMLRPMKSGEPGVSIRFTCLPPVVKLVMAASSECSSSFSMGSKSHTVVPLLTLPGAGTTPVAASSASTRVVFPEPAWPIRAMLRTSSAL